GYSRSTTRGTTMRARITDRRLRNAKARHSRAPGRRHRSRQRRLAVLRRVLGHLAFLRGSIDAGNPSIRSFPALLVVQLAMSSRGLALLATIASAQGLPPFLNILPPGENGLVTAADAVAFEANGARPVHFDDQLSMYGDLVYAPPGLDDAGLLTYFK